MNRNPADFPKSKNEAERQANIRRASDMNDAYNNPCLTEQKLTYQCLSDNHYDRDACSLYFHNYRRCVDFWLKIKSDRRKKGISPDLPWPDEREEILRAHKESK